MKRRPHKSSLQILWFNANNDYTTTTKVNRVCYFYYRNFVQTHIAVDQHEVSTFQVLRKH